jgi:hypothetical protein
MHPSLFILTRLFARRLLFVASRSAELVDPRWLWVRPVLPWALEEEQGLVIGLVVVRDPRSWAFEERPMGIGGVPSQR